MPKDRGHWTKTLSALRCDLQWWAGHIHIPDIPTWALVAGGAGAGGLIYYYNFFKRGKHAHVEPYTGVQCRGCMATLCTIIVESIVYRSCMCFAYMWHYSVHRNCNQSATWGLFTQQATHNNSATGGVSISTLPVQCVQSDCRAHMRLRIPFCR